VGDDLLICTTYAGLIKLFHSSPAVGFIAQARLYQNAMANGELLGTAKNMAQMQQVMINGYVNAALTALFLFVVVSILMYSLRTIAKARRSAERTDKQTAYVALSEEQQQAWL